MDQRSLSVVVQFVTFFVYTADWLVLYEYQKNEKGVPGGPPTALVGGNYVCTLIYRKVQIRKLRTVARGRRGAFSSSWPWQVARVTL